jgi:trehalose 2-sulfotransferase
MIQGNVKKIDHLMSRERDFPPRPAGASFRYLLCSTPRCGSNMISQILHDTGVAGDPLEYLNVRYMAGYVRSRGGPERSLELGSYVRDLETRRSSPNGVFGLKMHFEHLVHCWKDRSAERARFLAGFDKIVLLWRRDKIAQAVSLHKARVTQIWSSIDRDFLDQDDPRRSRKAPFDAVQIAKALADLVEQETGWRRLLQAQRRSFLELCYEDLVADPIGQAASLLEGLGLRDAVREIPAPSLERQGGGDNDAMVSEFRRIIGLEGADSSSVRH